MMIVLSIIATSCQSFVESISYSRQNEVDVPQLDADLIVVGSSVAGWAAALAAGRRGTKTLIISETSCFGGQAGCAGVGSWDGIGYGSLDKLLRSSTDLEYKIKDVRLGGCYGAEPIPYSGSVSQIVGRENYLANDAFCPNPRVVGTEMKAWINVFDSNIKIVGPVDVLSIGLDGSVVTSDGTLNAKIVIEATETGELIPVSLRHPVEALCKQHVTWVANITEPGSPGARIGDLVYPTDSGYITKLADWWGSGKYHWAGLTGEEGLPVYRRSHTLDGRVVLGLNWLNDAATSAESKDLTMQQLVFLGSHGYQDWTWELNEIPYRRTSDYRLDGESYLGATPRGVDSFPDSVAIGNYRSDYHGTDCPALEASEPYGQYDVPLGIGVPVIRVPVLVAMPRSGDISDVRATSFRPQPNEADFGEAIGDLASLAIEQGVLPQDVSIDDVRRLLVATGSQVDVG